MIINKNNLEMIDELYLHDLELENISIDYFNHRVEIMLKDQKKTHIIKFDHMQSFLIRGFEPWGEVAYISEIKVIVDHIEKLIKIDESYVIKDQAFVTEILINSGDKIIILATKIEYVS